MEKIYNLLTIILGIKSLFGSLLKFLYVKISIAVYYVSDGFCVVFEQRVYSVYDRLSVRKTDYTT